MQLPNADVAEVDKTKILDYLLSETHPVGRFKAAYFRGIGYSPARWQLLARHLLEAAWFGQARLLATSSYGAKYSIRCTMSGHSGASGDVETIWIVGFDDIPRFVTAYPAGRS